MMTSLLLCQTQRRYFGWEVQTWSGRGIGCGQLPNPSSHIQTGYPQTQMMGIWGEFSFVNTGLYEWVNVLNLCRGCVRRDIFWMGIAYWQLQTSRFCVTNQGRRRRRGRGGGACAPPTFKSVGGTSGFVPPPTFGQSKCSYFTICSYFVVKNTIFSNFSWLASLANLYKSIFSKFC